MILNTVRWKPPFTCILRSIITKCKSIHDRRYSWKITAVSYYARIFWARMRGNFVILASHYQKVSNSRSRFQSKSVGSMLANSRLQFPSIQGEKNVFFHYSTQSTGFNLTLLHLRDHQRCYPHRKTNLGIHKLYFKVIQEYYQLSFHHCSPLSDFC